MSALSRGWRFPLNSRKAHYFLDGESISLCRKWMYTGESEDTNHDSPDNCAECRRRRARLIELA